jgi:ribonuclease HI
MIWNHQKIAKRVRPQNTIYSAEQLAIITAIHSTMKEPWKKVIATDSLCTLIAASYKKDTNKPKTQTIRKQLEQQEAKITLLWLPNHVRIQENKEVDNVAKESLDKNLEKTQEYPPQDLANWMTQEHEEQQQR